MLGALRVLSKAPWPAGVGVLSAFITSQHSCPGCGWLGPSWPPVVRWWGLLGECLCGQAVRAGFLGPPRVLSRVATSEGPFVCPFIQKSGCNCVVYKAPNALTSHPCLWPGGERVSQAPCEGNLLPLPGSQTPRPSTSGPTTCSFGLH